MFSKPKQQQHEEKIEPEPSDEINEMDRMLDQLLPPDLANIVRDHIPEVTVTYTNNTMRGFTCDEFRTADPLNMQRIEVRSDCLLVLSGWCATNTIEEIIGPVNLVGDCSFMFRGATAFKGDVSGWDTSNVTQMTAMFSGATSFNGDVSGWNVSGVWSMSYMFYNATSFSGDLSKWEFSSIKNMG